MKKAVYPMVFVEQIEEHVGDRRISFHVPGHHNGTVFCSELPEALRRVMPYDLTELDHLDDLHHPEGIIAEAQSALGRLFQANSKWLVNGSTSGNFAMLAATTRRGDRVYIQRNSHKSVWNAIEWLGLEAVLLNPEVDRGANIATVVSPSTVRRALNEYPGGKAILLTSPTYYGDMADIVEIRALADEFGMFLLVDEAHGAHLLSSVFPKRSAIFMGAHAVVQSAHKSLPAFTSGAWLHYTNDIPESRLEHALSGFQTSSPSYLTMASLDHARYYLESLTEQTWREIRNSHVQFRETLQLKGFQLKDTDDFTKVTLLTYPENGLALRENLSRIGLDVELAANDHVLLCLPLRVLETKEIEQWSSLIEMAAKHLPKSDYDESIFVFPKSQPVGMLRAIDVREEQPTERCCLEKAVGRISAETIIPYPPGVPWILKGELITDDHVRVLKEWISLGRQLQASSHVMINKEIDVLK